MLQALWLFKGQASTSVTSHYLPDKCTATVIYIGGNPGSAALSATLREIIRKRNRGITPAPCCPYGLGSGHRAVLIPGFGFDLGLPALRDDALADKGLPFAHHTDCL